jgi:predicted signal transduction protein with EAL and GGDEF domain
MLEEDSKLAIVKSTIGLGRALELDVTAEGVEDASAYQRLAELDCDFVQGFHLGRPADADRCRDHILRYVADFRRRRGLKVWATITGGSRRTAKGSPPRTTRRPSRGPRRLARRPLESPVPRP